MISSFRTLVRTCNVLKFVTELKKKKYLVLLTYMLTILMLVHCAVW